MKITAAVISARSAPFELQTLDLAGPLADEVLVRVVATGMCHTDLHARDGYFPNLPYPIVCGHEGAGIVEEVGAAVADLAPGDPVVISFPWCGECKPCRADKPSYCVHGRALKSSGRRTNGSTPMSRDGMPVYSCFFQQSSFASFAVAPAKDVVKLRRDALGFRVAEQDPEHGGVFMTLGDGFHTIDITQHPAPLALFPNGRGDEDEALPLTGTADPLPRWLTEDWPGPAAMAKVERLRQTALAE